MKATKSTKTTASGKTSEISPRENPLHRYDFSAIKMSDGENGLYERHLTFDQIIPVQSATPRDKFEAIAHSIRDLLSQRWLKTEET